MNRNNTDIFRMNRGSSLRRSCGRYGVTTGDHLMMGTTAMISVELSSISSTAKGLKLEKATSIEPSVRENHTQKTHLQAPDAAISGYLQHPWHRHTQLGLPFFLASC